MGGLCRRLSRFVLNDVVSAWMTFASSVDAISSTNEFYACDNSALREARVRERNSVPYRCVTSFGRVALIRHSQVRTTRCSRVGESLTPSVICSLRWAKLQINPSRLSSTNAMNLWNKYYGRSLGCNKLSISTPGCLSLSLRSCPGNQYLSRTRQPTAAFRWFSSGNLDDEGLACTPFAELDDIAVGRQDGQLFVVCTNTDPAKPGNSYRAPTRCCSLSSPDFYQHMVDEFLEVAVPDDVPANAYTFEQRTDSRCARSANITLLWPRSNIVSNVASNIRKHQTSRISPQLLKRKIHFCQVNLVLSPPDAVQEPMTHKSQLR